MEGYIRVRYKDHRTKSAENFRIRTKSDYLQTRDEIIKNRIKQQEKLEERRKVVGSGDKTARLIIEGSNDRISGVLYNPNKYFDEKDQGAYHDGFFRHGARRLFANLDKITPQILIKIGYNDCLSGIGINDLPNTIQTCREYILGYNTALKTQEGYCKPKTKSR